MKTNMKKIIVPIILLFISILSMQLNANQEMRLIENKGQWDENILFASQKNGLLTSVTKSGIYFDFFKKKDNRIIGEVIKMQFSNSNSLNFKPKDSVEGTFNYLLGNNSSKWFTDVESFKTIVADNIYEGIDLVYYIDDNNPRYDFIIEPYANPQQININFEGINSISLENENVKLLTKDLVIDITNLFAYQVENNKRKKIECSFNLIGDKLSFKLGEYDQSKTLVIDPIIYSSYFGSAGDDIPSKIKFIDDYSFILVGSTNSVDFKTTSGAYDEEYGNRTDAFVTKFNIINAEYIPEFTTYLGSLEYDQAIDCLIDKDFLLITGVTESPDFPNVKAVNKSHRGGKDIFITSLSHDGKSILQSTYYGGTGDDIIVKCTKIRNNILLFLGSSTSSNIPTVSGPPDSKYKNGVELLLFTLSSDRETVNMSAYLGGQLDDVPTDMFVDPNSDKIYITGHTTSPKGSSNGFPIFPTRRFGRGGPYDETHNGRKDAFAIMLTPNAESIVISTFLGGDGDDIGRGIWSDANENIYVMGETYNNGSGLDFPVSSGTAKIQGNSDIFITMFNDLVEAFGIKTQTLNYSKIINSQGSEQIRDFQKFPEDNIFSVLISTERRFEGVDPIDVKAKIDMVYSEFEPSAGSVIYSKNYGGNEDDIPVSLDFDSTKNYILTGFTDSPDFKTTDNATQTNKSTNKDIVIVRDAKGNLNLLNPPSNQTLCINNEVNISWSVDELNLDDGFSIAFSYDEGNNEFTTIASNLTNSSYVWLVPEVLSGKDNVKIRVTHNSGVYGQNIVSYFVNEAAKLESFELMTPDTVCIGESIILRANSKGEDINYTWFKDNKEIAKTSINEFTIDNVKTENSGNYKVSIKNVCLPASSSENSIKVFVSPETEVSELESTYERKKGETLEITINPKGSKLNYKWQKDGKTLSSQTTKTLMLSNLSLTDAGKYRCIVTGSCGIDTTNATDLLVNDVIGSVPDIMNLDEIARIIEMNSNSYKVEMNNSLNGNFELFDNLGNKLTSTTFNNNLEVDLNAYSIGVYWLVITQGDNKYKTKLIKIN